ncbi:protein of unknown function [Burkholderia multivorans]
MRAENNRNNQQCRLSVKGTPQRHQTRKFTQY